MKKKSQKTKEKGLLEIEMFVWLLSPFANAWWKAAALPNKPSLKTNLILRRRGLHTKWLISFHKGKNVE